MICYCHIMFCIFIKILYREFQTKQVENLRKETILRPKRIEKYIIILTVLVIIMYMYIVIVKIWGEMAEILSY